MRRLLDTMVCRRRRLSPALPLRAVQMAGYLGDRMRQKGGHRGKQGKGVLSVSDTLAVVDIASDDHHHSLA